MAEQSNQAFSDFKLTRQWIEALEQMGIDQPTPIQEKTYRSIENGAHVVGVAPTGTGKTIAYLLPLFRKLSHAQGNSPRLLIFVPTRELVQQVHQVAVSLCSQTDLRVLMAYGGVGPKAQAEAIAKGVDVVVATPGRFMELYLKGELPVKLIRHLVIDEADRMMDMGFMPQLRKLFEVLPPKRQNLLFSATLPEKVERLIAEFIDFPERIEASPQATVAVTIDHRFYRVPNYLTKIRLLDFILTGRDQQKVLIFARSKKTAEEVNHFISRKISESTRAIHGNKAQSSRINAMEGFKQNELQYLVATDLAARGIDVQGVDLVINLDAPLKPEDYVHRIGRTGRAGKTGEAVTFVSPNDEIRIEQIQELIKSGIKEELLPEELRVEETSPAEARKMAMEIDEQKRRNDTEFKGAFHQKKRKNKTAKTYKSSPNISFTEVKSGNRNRTTSPNKKRQKGVRGK